MRLFFAIPLPEIIKDHMLEEMSLFDACMKKVPHQNLHITACFLGDVKEDAVAGVITAAKEIICGHESFALMHKHNRLVFRKKRPVMAWAEFHQHEEFKKLHQELSKTLLGKDEREQIPHVTLARIKDSCKVNYKPSVKALPELQVSRIELWRSHLDAKGSEYEKLSVFELRSGER